MIVSKERWGKTVVNYGKKPREFACFGVTSPGRPTGTAAWDNVRNGEGDVWWMPDILYRLSSRLGLRGVRRLEFNG